jgi:hypothetical protein
MAFVGDGVICVVLNYGADSDWVRNVLAAGTAGVAHRGGRFTLINPRILAIDAARARTATEGFGARLLAYQDPDGQWVGGAFFPADFDYDGPEAAEGAGRPWTVTTWTLNSLREWGLDDCVLRERHTVELLAENSRWEYGDLPYGSGEVDCCINAWTVANGVWLGADINDIDEWFLEHQMSEGGWNCDWVEGSARASFHSMLNSLKGLLAYDATTGGTDETHAARRFGQEYISLAITAIALRKKRQ